MKKLYIILSLPIFLLFLFGCNNKKKQVAEEAEISDEALLDSVQRRTFNYVITWMMCTPKMTKTL